MFYVASSRPHATRCEIEFLSMRPPLLDESQEMTGKTMRIYLCDGLPTDSQVPEKCAWPTFSIIERCPVNLWMEGDQSVAFWCVAYHTLFYTH